MHSGSHSAAEIDADLQALAAACDALVALARAGKASKHELVLLRTSRDLLRKSLAAREAMVALERKIGAPG